MLRFKDLMDDINAVNRANGWDVTTPADWADDRIIPTLLALVHSEVSEALEAFRKGDKYNFNEEMADIIIRVLDICGGLNIDIETEIMEKLDKNRKRGYRHGGKRV